jgi:four helix bundle protein
VASGQRREEKRREEIRSEGNAVAVAHYQQLLVWQKAMDFAVACYQATDRFPKAQTYRLCDQLQRAAVSIPSNIAEGQGKGYTNDFLRHLAYAAGSLCESETQVIIAQRLGYLTPDAATELLQASAEIGRMLNGLVASLERKRDAPS